MPSFNRAVLGLASFAAGLYYRRHRLGGEVPASGPVLLVGNHPNGLVDPIFLAGATRRPVRFLGKAPLLSMPVLGPVIRALGTLPVYRPRDGYDTAANERTFDAVHAALAAGDVVALFPEGTTHGAPRLEKLKTGAARMALGAERRAGFALGVRIVPVGLSFRAKGSFRSLAATWVGEPIDAGDLAELDARDERAAALLLTERIARGLRAVTLELDAWEDLPLVELAERILPADLDARRVARIKRVSEGAAALRARDPQRLEALRRDLGAFQARLERLGIDAGDLAVRYTPASVARFAVWNALVLCVGLPLGLAGAVLWWPPYRAAAPLARLARPDPEVFATAVLLASLVLFPLWWAGLAVAGGLAGGALGAAAALFCAPLLGVFGLRFWEGRRRAAEDLRVFLRLGPRRSLRARLIAERDGLARRLEAVALEIAADPAPAASPSPAG